MYVFCLDPHGQSWMLCSVLMAFFVDQVGSFVQIDSHVYDVMFSSDGVLCGSSRLSCPD